MDEKYEKIHKFRKSFVKMHDANIVSWNAIIIGYVQNRYVERDNELFDNIL